MLLNISRPSLATKDEVKEPDHGRPRDRRRQGVTRAAGAKVAPGEPGEDQWCGDRMERQSDAEAYQVQKDAHGRGA